VIPVFIHPVNEEDVGKSDLAPSGIHALQAIRGGTPAEIIKGVEAALADLAERRTPIDFLCEYVKKVLVPVTEEMAISLSDELCFELGSWKSDPHRDLALALMSSNLKSAVQTLVKIRDFLTDDEFYDLFEIVAISWVDARSAETLSRHANGDRNQRLVAINAGRALTAECYVKKACGRRPLKCWKIVSIDGVFGDDPMKTLQAKVERALLKAFNFTDADQLREKLLAKEDVGEPVVVALPGAGLDGPLLQHLRDAFPTVTFFALAGEDVLTRKTLERSGVEVLQPKLDPTFEEWFEADYKRKRSGLDLA
jgi:hypothetical protein